MRSNQGESILVILNGPDGDHPVFHVVTLFAFRPHLAAVDVGMAIRTIFAGIGKDGLDVTSATLDTLMRP